MDIFLQPETYVALLTLTFLEVVLGIDNIIFISILSNKLPEEKRQKARNIGLSLALFMRIGLLFGITWIIKFQEPLFSVFDHAVSGRDLILLLGGLFLIGKSTSEIHHKMEGASDEVKAGGTGAALSAVIVQIVIMDIIFSFDSILTAVGLSDQILIMILAVVIALVIMMTFAGKISAFIQRNPTLEVLALSFLILIGFMLMLESLHYEVPKGYIYFAVFFSLLVEFLNIRIRKKGKKVELNKKMREQEWGE